MKWIEPIQEKMDNILEGTETLKCGSQIDIISFLWEITINFILYLLQ